MSRPRAGVDLDGVVYEWEAQARLLLSAWWGVSLPESTHYYSIRDGLIERLGEATGRMADSWLFTDGWRYGLWDRGENVPGAFDALRRLSLIYDIAFVTKRPRVAIPPTWDWLAFNRFHPTELIVIPPDSDRGKSTIGADWYVDDSPAVAEELSAAGKVIYLFDRPWNRDCQFGVRVSGWDGLLKRVLKGAQ